MVLKHGVIDKYNGVYYGCNRTIMVLKHWFEVVLPSEFGSCNRTIMVLKPCQQGSAHGQSSSLQSNHYGIETPYLLKD